MIGSGKFAIFWVFFRGVFCMLAVQIGAVLVSYVYVTGKTDFRAKLIMPGQNWLKPKGDP